jgi:hypothetical protein
VDKLATAHVKEEISSSLRARNVGALSEVLPAPTGKEMVEHLYATWDEEP